MQRGGGACLSKAHILLPKSTLLRFSDTKSGGFDFLMVDKNVIKRAFAKTYDVEPNYYPEDIEGFLNELESKLGMLNEAIEAFIENKGQLVYDHDLVDLLALCCTVQLLRVPDMMRITRSKSFYGKFGFFDDKFYSLLHSDRDFALNSIAKIQRSFRNYEANFCLVDDKCSLSFLLPSAHWFGGDDQIFFVISPRIAFLLMPKEMNNRYRDGNKQRYMLIENENVMRSIYARELVSERQWKNPVLIGYKKDLLIAQEIKKTLPPIPDKEEL